MCSKIFILAAFLFVTYSHFSLSMNLKQYQECACSDSQDEFAYRTLRGMSKNAETQYLYTMSVYNVEAEHYTEIDCNTIELLLEISKQLHAY